MTPNPEAVKELEQIVNGWIRQRREAEEAQANDFGKTEG